MTTVQSVITIFAVVAGTMLTRFLPFLIFPEGKKPPRYITWLGTVLPHAVIGLLVVYCLKDAVFSAYHGLPELIAQMEEKYSAEHCRGNGSVHGSCAEAFSLRKIFFMIYP